ncbi:MAG: PKD domain-containing protein [candidate division WOR-3 bacterium]|uniref:PKD domain-containing protein n=1 Tax=candidate division WOR-3 bacterium TaxID=2052148 RepID=A0A7C3EU05_UNCW3|nr:PKD domain-containing protein [candidate division WOR-3 bacterium]
MRNLGGVIVAILLAGCYREGPPRMPSAGGPDSGQPQETLRFFAVATDPNRDNISYLFNWGDGSKPEWSAELASGDTMFMAHVYQESGFYLVQVRARDEKGNESEPALPVPVAISFFGPLVPSRPAGPEVAWPDTPLVFTTVVRHRSNDSVAVQFAFGDSLTAWSGFLPSGATVAVSRSFRSRGVFSVRCRAKDKAGIISPWSEPALVQIDFPPVKPPLNLRLAQHLGLYVRLRWDRNGNHDSVRYCIWFRQADSFRFRLVDSTLSTSFLHDPFYTTGDYTVSARFRSEELFSPETVSTIAVFTDTLTLSELNCAGEAGYGWDSISLTGRMVSMRNPVSDRICAFYLTDFSPESLSLNYFLASPHLGPDDPGGLVPPAAWRRTWLVNVTGSGSTPLPPFDTLLYRDRILLNAGTTEIAVWLPSDNYALVKVLPTRTCRFDVLTWYQRVPGLRLLYPVQKSDTLFSGGRN